MAQYEENNSNLTLGPDGHWRRGRKTILEIMEGLEAVRQKVYDSADDVLAALSSMTEDVIQALIHVDDWEKELEKVLEALPPFDLTDFKREVRERLEAEVDPLLVHGSDPAEVEVIAPPPLVSIGPLGAGDWDGSDVESLPVEGALPDDVADALLGSIFGLEVK